MVDHLHRVERELLPNKRSLFAGAVLPPLAVVTVLAQGLVLGGGAGRRADQRAGPRTDPRAAVKAPKLTEVIKATVKNRPGWFVMAIKFS
jgi:hypothetical protein